MLTRRYTFKLYPSASQRAVLDEHRRLHGILWNAMLEQREMAWRHGTRITFFDQQKEIKAIKRELPEFSALPSASMGLTAKRLDLAFQAFFRRAKQGCGASSGYPRYRRVVDYPTIGYRDGAWLLRSAGGPRNWRLTLSKFTGEIKARGKFPGEVVDLRSGEVIYKAGEYWFSAVVSIEKQGDCPPAAAAVIRLDKIEEFGAVEAQDGGRASASKDENLSDQWGVSSHPAGRPKTGGDHGSVIVAALVTAQNKGGTTGLEAPQLAHFVLLNAHEHGGDTSGDDGFLHLPCLRDIPEQGKKQPEFCISRDTVALRDSMISAANLGYQINAMKSRRDTMLRGSKRRERMHIRIARLSKRQANIRSAAAHKYTTALARAYSDLTILVPPADARRSAKGTERDWGAMVSAVAQLNRHISGQAPNTIAAMLAYKTAERGTRCDIVATETADAAIGPALVNAGKAVRRLKRKAI